MEEFFNTPAQLKIRKIGAEVMRAEQRAIEAEERVAEAFKELQLMALAAMKSPACSTSAEVREALLRGVDVLSGHRMLQGREDVDELKQSLTTWLAASPDTVNATVIKKMVIRGKKLRLNNPLR